MKPTKTWLIILCCVAGMGTAAQTSTLVLPMPGPLTSAWNPDSLFTRLKEKLGEHVREQDEQGQALCLQQMGQLFFRLGSYTQAVDYLLQADQLFRKTQSDLLAGNLNNLGTVYYYNQQKDNARHQFEEALSIHQRNRNAAGLAETYGLIGHMHEKLLHYDSSFLYQRIALHFAGLASDTGILAKIYENLGSIHEDQERYDSAQYYFSRSLTAYQSTGRTVEQIEVINNLGDVWRKRGDFIRGMAYAREAAALAKATGEKYQLQSAYRDISQNFLGLGQNDSAYTYLEKSREMVQAIYSLENSYQIGVLQTLYDTEKKNAQIVSLNAARKANKILSWASILIAGMLAILATLVIRQQRWKIRNARTLNETLVKVHETEKGLLASELKRQQLEETTLKEQLDLQGRQLSSHLLHLVQKNEVMDELRRGLEAISKDDKRDQKKQVRQLLQTINSSVTQDSYWNEFRLIFDKVHPSFVAGLQSSYPGLTGGDLRLLTLIKMNLGPSDMSTLLGVTADSLRVQRYRVKKKLQLGADDSLTNFVHSV